MWPLGLPCTSPGWMMDRLEWSECQDPSNYCRCQSWQNNDAFCHTKIKIIWNLDVIISTLFKNGFIWIYSELRICHWIECQPLLPITGPTNRFKSRPHSDTAHKILYLFMLDSNCRLNLWVCPEVTRRRVWRRGRPPSEATHIRGRSHITSALFGVSGHPWWCCKPWSAFALTLPWYIYIDYVICEYKWLWN